MNPVETGARPATSRAEDRDASQPIANYALLADCNSAALVDRSGSIDWLCLPRYDSSAIFSRLLDPDAGHWSIRPSGSYSSEEALPAGNARPRDGLHHRQRQRPLRDAMAFAPGQRSTISATTPRTR